MDFFITHYTFTFCLMACFVGTLVSCISPYFAEEYLSVDGRKFNLGTLGFSIFVHEGWGHFLISFICAIPGLLICERCYGEELTLAIVVLAGVYEGLLGLIFDKSCCGFSAIAVLLGTMACLYGYHWYGIVLGIIVLSYAVSMDTQCDSNNIHTLTLVAGVLIVLAFGKTTSKFDKPKKIEADTDFILPVNGLFSWSSDYGTRSDPFTGRNSFHKGTDMACAEGTEIVASSGGTVESVGYDDTYGNYVVINHENGYKTKYAHLAGVFAHKGDRVSQGENIGTAGSTGYSTGPHLHFMVYKNGKVMNPKNVLNN